MLCAHFVKTTMVLTPLSDLGHKLSNHHKWLVPEATFCCGNCMRGANSIILTQFLWDQ